MTARSLLSLPLILTLLATGSKIRAAEPPMNGLAVWIDVADAATLTVSPGNGVAALKNKGRTGGTAVPCRGEGAQLVENGLGGKPVLRFHDKQSYQLEGGLAGVNEATVFVVFRRDQSQVGGGSWQRVVCGGDPKSGISLHTGNKDVAMPADVLRETFKHIGGSDLMIATPMKGGKGNLTGDIAEILVYERSFYVEDQMQEVVRYLTAKWGFEEPAKDEWTRVGPLGETITRTRHDLPLSDQANAGKWTAFEPLSDEFEGSSLDASKWLDHNPTWFGRMPGRFMPENIEVRDGELQLTMRKESGLDTELPVPNADEFRDYTSAIVVSRQPTVYGYFEIEAKPMASAGSSAFWLTGTAHDRQQNGRFSTEIDVFEIGGKTVGKETYYNMNLHVFQTPEEKRHWNQGSTWKAPFKLIDDFHTYGLEWGPETIRYFVDGHLVRELKNTHCHSPMAVLFDSETMFDWLGVPEDADLPSTYRVKYIRTWKNAPTSTPWTERYEYRKATSTPISKYHAKRLKRAE